MRRRNEKPKKKKGCLSWIGLSALVFVALGLAGAFDDDGTESANEESVSIEGSIKQEESESISIEESIKGEESIQQAEKEAQEAEHEAKRQTDPMGFEAEEAWGSNLDRVDFNADTGLIVVHAQMSDNFSSSWIVSGFESSALNFLEAIENEDFSSVSIMGYFNMVDAYGNEENMNVYDLQLSKETVDQINFDNFSQDNLSKVADFYYLHNAFQ